MTLLERVFLICAVGAILFPFVVVVILYALEAYHMRD